MKKELSDLQTAYTKNLNEENTSFEYSREQLEGLPESFFNESRAVRDGVFKVTMKYPDIIPSLKYIKDEEVRKELYFAFNNRCATENTPLFERAVKLRDQIAKKLGYNSHADFQTEVKIVKNAQTAVDFLNNMNNLVTPLYEQEMKEVLEFAKSYEARPLNKEKLDGWDTSYYHRAYGEYKYNIDQEEIKQYFPIDTVRSGLFEIYQKSFGLTFEEVETNNKWHKDVKLFSVKDTNSLELLGFFYLDMWPRDGKYGHAAAFNFMAGCDNDHKKNRRPNIVTMACNFDANGCISFGDVVTFFHEFGHVIAFICGRPQLHKHSGFSVESDFIETMSQALEYFCYCDAPLALLSSHKETGEKLSQELVEKIKLSKNLLAGYFHKRQLVFGLFDLAIHIENLDNKELDSCKVWDDVEEQVLGERPNVKLYRAANFGHLMSEMYTAGYYGYLRANTYAANIFHVIFKDNVLSPEAGMRYRTKLLEPGSTKDGLDLLRDLLGEEPNDKYYVKEIGLE